MKNDSCDLHNISLLFHFNPCLSLFRLLLLIFVYPTNDEPQKILMNGKPKSAYELYQNFYYNKHKKPNKHHIYSRIHILIVNCMILPQFFFKWLKSASNKKSNLTFSFVLSAILSLFAQMMRVALDLIAHRSVSKLWVIVHLVRLSREINRNKVCKEQIKKFLMQRRMRLIFVSWGYMYILILWCDLFVVTCVCSLIQTVRTCFPSSLRFGATH